MHFILFENTINFTSSSLNFKAIDSYQKSIIYLSNELVKKGHKVTIFNNILKDINEGGILWKQLSKIDKTVIEADVLVICDDEDLLDIKVKAKIKLFWMKSSINTDNYQNILVNLLKHKFIILYHSNYLISSLPLNFRFVPKVKIQIGISDKFFQEDSFDISKCNALVTTHPLRGLDWLIDVWVKKINLKLPWAEMHIYSNILFTKDFVKNIKVNNLKLKLLKHKNSGIHIKKPQIEAEFIKTLANYRVHLNPCNDNKFLLSGILESQARGIPIVSRNNSDLSDYIYHNHTGYITNDQSIYSKKTIDLLSNNSLYLRMRNNSKLNNKINNWKDIVEDFERKIYENIIHR